MNKSVGRDASPSRPNEGRLGEASLPTKPLGELCDIEGGNAAPQGEEYSTNGTILFVRMKDLGCYHFTNNLTESNANMEPSAALRS
jgi:hypothetical protein